MGADGTAPPENRWENLSPTVRPLLESSDEVPDFCVRFGDGFNHWCAHTVLRLNVAPSSELSQDVHRAIVSLCNAAYEEDLAGLLVTLGPATHVFGTIGTQVVSHAMWVTRWLQPEGSPPLKTAYIEVVATHPAHQRKSYATQVMRHLTDCIPDCYELAALSPATTDIYARLGWKFWRGPLSIRLSAGAREATPGETVMVLELPGRRALNLAQPLSAEWREGELW